MMQRLGKFGSRFAFEFFLESMRELIVKNLRTYLTPIQPDDIPKMVQEGRFPPLEHLDFSAASGFYQDNAALIDRITLLRLMEYLAEARPDLAIAIQDMGMPGAEYMAKLHVHLLDLIKHPEKSLVKSIESRPEAKMKQATCDKCGKSWPVPEDKVAEINKCPFCGAGKDQ